MRNRIGPSGFARLLVAAALIATALACSPPATVTAGAPPIPSVAPVASSSPPVAGTSTPPPTAKPPLTMPRSVPVRVEIPAINLDTELVKLGLDADGAMQVPAGGFPAGWFTGAPTPGELGPAIVVGHVHWQRKAGVFGKLANVEAGDQIRVTRADGSIAVFVVSRTEQVTKRKFPTSQVYGNIAFAGLRLITCGGYDRSSREYEDNVIVFAKLVGTRKA